MESCRLDDVLASFDELFLMLDGKLRIELPDVRSSSVRATRTSYPKGVGLV